MAHGEPLAVPHRDVSRWIWRNLAVVVLAIVAVGGTYLAVRVQQTSTDTTELARQNRERIADVARESRQRDSGIQASRIYACQQVYDGISLLFRPYNPDPPTSASRQFVHRLHVLKRRCAAQILKPRKAVTP